MLWFVMMMHSNVIVGITISRGSFVFSQSCVNVCANVTNVGSLAVGAFDLVNCSLSLTLVSIVTYFSVGLHKDSDFYQARGNQIVEHSSDNGTALGSSRKPGGAAEHLIDGSEKRICRLNFEF